TVRRRREDKRARANGRIGVTRVCTKHGKTVFVARSEGGYRCGKCRMAAVSSWRRKVKRRPVGHAGGAWEVCGYDRYVGALQCHQLDAESKEFSISRNGTTRSWSELRAEADKCALLCANCHAEVEAGMAQLSPREVPLRLRAA